MRRFLNPVLALACICSIGVAVSFAGGPACSGDKTAKAEGSCTKTCSGSANGLPTIAMMVDGKSYECCMSAAKAAKDANSKVVYVVGDQKFDSKDKATVALASATEEYVDNFMTVACVADGKVMLCKDKTSCCAEKGKSEMTTAKAGGAACCKEGAKAGATGASCTKDAAKTTGASAKSEGCCSKDKAKAVAMTADEIHACCKTAKEVKYMVLGRTFKTHDEALKARERAMDAVKSVKMTYIVDGKEVGCASEVCPKAKADGKVVYVVNKEKINCEYEARIALAKAKFDAVRDLAEKLAKI